MSSYILLTFAHQMLDKELIDDVPLLSHWPESSDWTGCLSNYFSSPECKSLSNFVCSQRQRSEVFPHSRCVFASFHYCSFAQTKVVILGQDPYHGPNQAHGLCFSVPNGIKAPPSLKNIFAELSSDLGIPRPSKTDLTPWARQGVLLLNTVLTVTAGKANSHRKRGWECFTDLVIQKLDQRKTPVIFVLWGKTAAAKSKLISDRHRIIEAPHPSPLSAYRGFFGSKPFSTINSVLRDHGQTAIDWKL